MNIAPLLYRNTMVEVKQRFRAIDRILGAKKPRTLTEEFDNEFMWLQIRKIVELVVFGGIMADEQRYGTAGRGQGLRLHTGLESEQDPA